MFRGGTYSSSVGGVGGGVDPSPVQLGGGGVGRGGGGGGGPVGMHDGCIQASVILSGPT